MSDTTPSATSPSSVVELMQFAKRKKWCVDPCCTFCRSRPFRKALNEMRRDEIIASLRLMTVDFIGDYYDMCLVILDEISSLGDGADLVEPLAGTPAGYVLRRAIEAAVAREEKRRTYEASQTPEAIADYRSKKKEMRL